MNKLMPSETFRETAMVTRHTLQITRAVFCSGLLLGATTALAERPESARNVVL